MKIKNLFAILLAITVLSCSIVLPTSAKESTENNINVEIIINEEVSAETRAKIENFFANGEPATDNGVSSYGLTCTLFGHNIKVSSVSAITHKVRASAPRCKKETYDYEECTRCDYEKATLIATEYIYCCA